MNIAKFSVNKRVTVTMMILIIVLFGFMSFSKLGLDLLPDIEYPTVYVITSYSGVSSREIEEQISKPIEEVVLSVKGVKSIKSTSEEGSSMVTVEFEWGTNLDFAAQDVRDMIGQIENYLPEEAGAPLVFKFSTSMMPAAFYGITGDCDLKELYNAVKDKVKDRLERLDGVASCALTGGRDREISVFIDETRLVSYGLGLTQILPMLQASNMNFSAGYLNRGYKEYSIRVEGEYKTLEDVKNTVIGNKNGVPIKIKDVGEVIDGNKDVRGYGRTQGKESVVMVVTKQGGANTVTVSDRINKEMEKIKETIPYNIKFHTIFDQGDMIKDITKNTSTSALEGCILAILFVFLFLTNWRPTLTIALAIPFSIIATFIAMNWAGYTLNVMTLAGIALASGMLVDDAVVVIESIYRKVEEGNDRKSAAVHGTNEVLMAVTASTLTTIAVFVPLAFATGVAGKMSRAFALTISFALLASLLIAFTVVPMLASILFKKKDSQIAWEKKFNEFREWYGRILQYSLNHKRKVLSIVGIVFVGTMFLIPFIGKEFMSSFDIPFIQAGLTMPVGTSLEETDRVALQIENAFKSIPEMETVTSFVGTSGSEHSAMEGAAIHKASIMGRLVDKKKRKRGAADVTVELRKKLPKIEGAKIDFSDVSSGMFGNTGAPIDIKIFGKDFPTLQDISSRIAHQIKDVRGVKEVDISMKEGKPELQIKIDKEKASLFGLTTYQIGQEVRTAVYGTVASRFRDKGEDININIKLNKIDVKEIQDIENIPIATPFGTTILLKQVANIIYTEGPVKIEREEQTRKVSVTANIEKRDVGGVAKDITKKIATIRKNIPAGYFIEFGGEFQKMNEAFFTLGIAFIFAILLVYMIMAALFESLMHPFVIMFTVPLGIIGMIWGLLLTHKSLSMTSVMGLIILVGIVVKNGIIFIDYANQLRARGMDIIEALISAGKIRLRPILITALATMSGMIPMAFRKGMGAEMMAPMAVVVIFGLLVSTALTLIVIPIIYTIFDGFAKRTGIRARKTMYGSK
ncbi:MAG: efflux RND transporter permease subunit [bacterium]